MSASGNLIGPGGDNSLFPSTRIPLAVKLLSKNIDGISKNCFRLLLQLVVNAIEGRVTQDGCLDKIRKQCLLQKGQQAPDNLDELFAGLHAVVHAFLRLEPGSLKSEIFESDLRDLKFSEECIADMVGVLYGPKRASFDVALLREPSTPHLPRVERMQWRVDVIISSNTLSRVLEPSIQMRMVTSDGGVIYFTASIARFHQMRHAVAAALREMGHLEQKSLLKG
ncbi:COMM domain-containing protein 5-like [Ischnura elegans]|uniref:COMM domain-containing protein 5-like n=1 Tax=Ischnura elegans TaxID=197161 RepID=UPI001ED8B5F2|nr:COMM domain-containing protein 5-like [Ischnura elegans]